MKQSLIITLAMAVMLTFGQAWANGNNIIQTANEKFVCTGGDSEGGFEVFHMEDGFVEYNFKLYPEQLEEDGVKNPVYQGFISVFYLGDKDGEKKWIPIPEDEKEYAVETTKIDDETLRLKIKLTGSPYNMYAVRAWANIDKDRKIYAWISLDDKFCRNSEVERLGVLINEPGYEAITKNSDPISNVPVRKEGDNPQIFVRQ
ncbi:hypothetical protein C0583_02625 [Candidatus Parcubacteria bacterium]|nr:MAG: hypothetical protein C0583_02625 [Candidatus Parcubacteria bacterium]